MRQPDKVFLSERLETDGLPTDAVVTSVCGEHIPGGNFDWLGRLCLTHSEIDCFDQLESPRRKRQWLFGRLAAKDAVRMWMKQQYGIEFLHPLTFAILNDELGCPLVQMLFDLPAPPFITISHAGDRSFAAAAAGPIGIDAEPNDRLVEEILPHFAQPAEQQILAAFEDQSNAALRLWCAKEAVGKVRGTGLGGAPKNFELIDFEADGRLLVHHHPSADRYVVTSKLVDGILLAYVCSPLDEVALVTPTDAREYSQESQS
jgi:phosphopantetheinyl transferase (holo-ACP synthase)